MSTSNLIGAVPAHGSEQTRAFEPAAPMCWALAMLSFGAGAVHLVMVPQHAQESLRIGVAFAAAGWFQIAFGAALLARPRRTWLWLAIALNAALHRDVGDQSNGRAPRLDG